MLARFKLLIISGCMLLICALASAHHAFQAEFDANQPIKLRGTVVRMELINPHAWIHIDVKGDDGQVVRWMLEAGSPNTLIRKGLSKNSVPIGTQVVAEGYRAKDGSNKANGKEITLPDGQTFLLGTNAPQ